MAPLDTGRPGRHGRGSFVRARIARLIAALEGHIGAPLLHRTTRSLRLSEAGARYAATCRRVLTDLQEADLLAAGEATAARGVLSLTAPLVSGAQILRPVIDAFLDAQPAVRARLLLLDRPVSLIEEGIDVAVRIALLPDFSLIAIRIGEVRRVVVAAPAYLARRSPIVEPADLASHSVIAVSNLRRRSWSFAPAVPGGAPRHVGLAPRLVVNGVEAALGRRSPAMA